LPKPSFVVYIDESGDEGFSFAKGSSEWFVISAIITRKENDLATVKLVDEVRNRLEKPDKKPLHFRDLKHEQRLPFIGEIAKAKLRIVSTLAHKPSLKEPENFQERYRLYFYSIRYLLERVSWCCKENLKHDDAGDGSAEVFFSNRSGMSYDEMKRYLDYLKERTGILDVRIDWSVINSSQMTALTAGKKMGLQIADAVASSFYYAVQPSRHGYTEDRYARMLNTVVYHHKDRFLGNGLKFWPRELDEMIIKEERFEWVRAYQK